MSLTKYEILSTVAELGSLTKASEALGLTQSAVSHAISSLESEWGFSLLIRDRSGARLTNNGERVLVTIRELLQWNERLKQEVAAINGLEVGTVRIGTFTSVSAQWLPGIIKQFATLHPHIEIKLLEGDYDEIDAWISNGAVDFGFLTTSTSRRFEMTPLKRDRLVCILSKEHPLSDQNVISLEQIVEEPFIMPKWGSEHEVRRILQEKRLTLKVKYEAAEDQAILAMVRNNLGISILPEMVLYGAPDSIRLIPLEGNYARTIGIAANSMKTLSPAAKKFLDCIKSWLRMQNLLDF
jgi:DNA-binding transcriptional LysR family regulator